MARALLDAGYDVLAATRDPGATAATRLADLGARPVRVDLRDPATVTQAAQRAARAFMHLPMSLGGPDGADAERAAVDALEAAGIAHLVFNVGMALPDETVGQPMLDARIGFAAALLERGATVLVPTGYFENFVMPWSAPHVLDGELRYPLPPDAVNAWVTNDDVGACVVGAFAHADDARGRRFRVAGPEALTLPEVADLLGRALDREVEFRQISGEEYGQMLAPYVGGELAAAIGAGYDRMPPGPNPLLTPDTGAARNILDVTFTSVEAWAWRQDWQHAAGR